MTPLRKRKVAIYQAMLERNLHRRLEHLALDQMAPVGREFGSPDFDRLREADFRDQVGVFDPALRGSFCTIESIKKLPVQHRMKI